MTRNAEMFEFDSFRVFLWSTPPDTRYEDGPHITRNVKGLLPGGDVAPARSERGDGATFTLLLEDDDQIVPPHLHVQRLPGQRGGHRSLQHRPTDQADARTAQRRRPSRFLAQPGQARHRRNRPDQRTRPKSILKR